MKKMPLTIAMTLSLFVFPAMTSSALAGGADKASFEKSYQEAMDAYKKVDAMGGSWSNTEDMLKEASLAAGKNDFTTAGKLVKQAMDEIHLGQQQAEQQRHAGPYLF